jgi:hypothetical protein
MMVLLEEKKPFLAHQRKLARLDKRTTIAPAASLFLPIGRNHHPNKTVRKINSG